MTDREAQAGNDVPTGESSQHRISSGLLSLYLGAECGQSCAFCALKTYQPPRDDGERELALLLEHARAARALGVDHVQLEGIDPVRFSRILLLVEQLTALGFARLTVMGTARRFADAAFRRDFLARSPADTIVVVPVYGVTAEVHDAVTGHAGSFTEVSTAIDGLIAADGRVRVMLTTVPTPKNAGELAQILELGARLGIEVWGRLPYPLRQAGTEIYGAVAVRESDLVETFARSLPAITQQRDWVAGAFARMLAHPCVLYRAAERPGGALLRPSPEDRWRLEGVDTSTDRTRPGPIATVPCPHVAHCGLASRCPGEHYEAYEQRFGLEEFSPPAMRAPWAAWAYAIRDQARRWLAQSRAR